MRTIPAGEFKAKCLAIMDEVQAGGEPVIVTKRGKPVVQISSLEKKNERPAFDSMHGMAVITGDLIGSPYTDAEWESMQAESDAILAGKTSA